MKRDRFLKRWHHKAELLLWAVAALCFSVIVLTASMALHADRLAKRISAQTVTAAAVRSDTLNASPAVDPDTDGLIGRMEIPAIGLSVPVTSGIDSVSLLRGVGHIRGTAVPGGLGMMGLAGHRDTYFRPLERIGRGMTIRVISETGAYQYIVDSTEIVAPEQVDILKIQSRPELVLITCYPFHYVGAAPRRFVVHAHLVSAAPDTQDNAAESPAAK